MNKKMIGVGIAITLLITAVSVNYAYASMYGRAVAKALQMDRGEHISEVNVARQQEQSVNNEIIKESLRPVSEERRDEISSAGEYSVTVSEELRQHARQKKVASIVAGGQKGEYQLYAWSQFEKYGWDENDLVALINLWNKESGWSTSAHNGSSGAHGIPQALPASKMAAYGSDYMTDYKTQIDWGLDYVAGRYGSPTRAWSHFCSRNWY